LGQKVTIFRSGLGDGSERYSGKSLRSLRATIAGTSEMPTPARTSDWTVSNWALRKLMLGAEIPPVAKTQHLVAKAVSFLHDDEAFSSEIAR
jgi:hypothetical protein